MTDLRNSINSREIPKNENPNKLVSIVEKLLHFNKQQKGKGLLLNHTYTNSSCTSKIWYYIKKLTKQINIHILCVEQNKLLKKYNNVINLIKL